MHACNRIRSHPDTLNKCTWIHTYKHTSTHAQTWIHRHRHSKERRKDEIERKKKRDGEGRERNVGMDGGREDERMRIRDENKRER